MILAIRKYQGVDFSFAWAEIPQSTGHPKSKHKRRKQKTERKLFGHQVNVSVTMEELLGAVVDVSVLDLYPVLLGMRMRRMTPPTG